MKKFGCCFFLFLCSCLLILIGCFFYEVMIVNPVHPKLPKIDLEDYIYLATGEVISFTGERQFQFFEEGVRCLKIDQTTDAIFYQKDEINYLMRNGQKQIIQIDGQLRTVKLIHGSLFLITAQQIGYKWKYTAYIPELSKTYEIDFRDITYNGECICFIDKEYSVILLNLCNEEYSVLPYKASVVTWNQDKLILYNSTKREVKMYNPLTKEAKILFRHDQITKFITVDPSGRYLLFNAMQGRGLGELEVSFLADLHDGSVKLLPSMGFPNYLTGWITKEQVEHLENSGILIPPVSADIDQ